MTREEGKDFANALKNNYTIDFDKLPDFCDLVISALSENKGEWIEVVTERFPNGEKRMWHYECSACSTGEPPCPINKEHWDFCPNCGADMRGKSCNTCKNSNDDFSGECYECVKNIQNHYELQESEEDFPQAKDIEPTVKGFADTMDIIDRICEKEGE